MSRDDRGFETFEGRSIADRVAVTAAERGNCFADEIAIDFPSLAAPLDRVRSAYADPEDSHDTLSAEVLLSARQAFGGTTVPLDVPLRGLCPTCGGRGESWAETCERCAGSGAEVFRHQLTVSLPAGVSDGARICFRLRAPQTLPAWVELRVSIR